MVSTSTPLIAWITSPVASEISTLGSAALAATSTPDDTRSPGNVPASLGSISTPTIPSFDTRLLLGSARSASRSTSCGSSTTKTLKDSFSAPRRTASLIVSPPRRMNSRVPTEGKFPAGVPSMLVTISLTFTPASSAGLPGATSETITPQSPGSLRPAARLGVMA